MSEVDMLDPLDIHQYLLAHDVRHEIVRLPRTSAGASSLAEALRLPPHQCVAVHPFHTAALGGDVLAVVLTPSDITIDTDGTATVLGTMMRDRIGAAAQFAPARAALVSQHTDYLAGHLAPLLLPPDVIVVATQALVDLAGTTVYTATGDAGTALALRALDLLVLTHAIVLPDRRRVARRRPITIDLDPARSAAQFDTAVRRTDASPPRVVASKAAS
ncbi:MAG: hypothetical protein ACRDV3_01560 [Acidothermaceae bacterium]